MEQNYAVGQIWLLTRGQILSVGMGGIVDINHLALWENIDRFQDMYDIDDKCNCFLRVLALFHHFLEIERVENMSKTKQ
jgi:hypothetical protein